MFGSVKCKICVKPVYRMDPLINLDGAIIHKQCAKCDDCNCQITLSNFFKSDIGDKTTLLCKIHYLKRFSEGVGYPGEEKYKMKSAQASPVNTPRPGASDEKESFPSKKHLKRVPNSVLDSATASLASPSADETSGIARINSSSSVAVALSADRWENNVNAVDIQKKGSTVLDEEEPETTSVSTIGSGHSTARFSLVSDATRNSSVLLEAQKSKVVSGSDDMPAVPRAPGAEPGTVKNFLKLFQGSGKAPCPQSNAQMKAKAKESETAALGRSWKSEVTTQSGEAAVNKTVISRSVPTSDKSLTSPVRDDTKQLSEPPTSPSWVKPSHEDQ